MRGMYEALSAIKYTFLGREANCEAVSTQNVSYMRVLGITIGRQARISGNTSFSVSQFF